MRSEVWRSSVILRSHLLVLIASSDVLLDIDDVALVRVKYGGFMSCFVRISFGCFVARSKKRDSRAEA